MARRSSKKGGRAQSRLKPAKRAKHVLRRPKPIKSTVAGWVRKLQGAERQAKLSQLYTAVKEVRGFFSGFEARDGYKLNNLKSLSRAAADAVLRRAAYVRELRSRPGLVLSPRSARSKKVLRLHTGQGQIRGQKKYLFHTDAPERMRVKVRGRKVETLRKFVGKDGKPHVAVYKNYYFPFARHFRTWDQLLEVAEELIRRLPKGQYRVVSSLHDDIGVPTDKNMLLATMQRWFEEYGVPKPGMATSIIGFRWVGMDFKQTDRALTTADKIRAAHRKREEKRRRQARDLARKRLGRRK